jgi:hypothetical protein
MAATRFLHPVFALLMLVSVASAQLVPVDLVGKVEKATSNCNAKITHKIACSDLLLYGDENVDLSKFEGQQVRIKGTLQLALCVLVEVTSAESYSYTMTCSPSLGGAFRLGESAVFTTRAPFLSLVPLVVSGSKLFVPLAEYGHLGMGLPFIWVNTKIALLGFATTNCPIPNAKDLIGVTIYAQGMHISITPSGFTGRLTNVDCFTIQAPRE